MKKIIERIKNIKDNWMHSTFHEPASESDITAFEHDNNISIPQSYRDFLLLSDGAELFGGDAFLYGVKNARFKIGEDYTEGMVPKEFMILGFYHSRHVCFLPQKNCFIFYEYEAPDEIESECLHFDSFYDIMEYFIDIAIS